MDVRCEKCQTEYELDESRLKPGGVTVKCTTCGHMFKIRKRSPTQSGIPVVKATTGSGPGGGARAAAPSRSPELPPRSEGLTRPEPRRAQAMQDARTEPRADLRADQRPAVPRPIGPEARGTGPSMPPPAAEGERSWIIRLENGESRTCRELGTLQQWIITGVVSPESMISRTGKTWKRLGDIAELASFFIVADEAKLARANRGDGGQRQDYDHDEDTRPTQPVGPSLERRTAIGPAAAPVVAAPRAVIAPPPPLPAPPAAPPRMAMPTPPPPPAAAAPVAPMSERKTGGWAVDGAAPTMGDDDAGSEGPRRGTVKASDSQSFGGVVRQIPNGDAAFTSGLGERDPGDRGEPRFGDFDDDDVLPRRRSAGPWIALGSLLVIGGAVAAVYFFVLKPKAGNHSAAVIDAASPTMAAIDGGTPDLPVPVGGLDGGTSTALAGLIDDARTQLGRDSATALIAAAKALADGGGDVAPSLALRARLATAQAQIIADEADLAADAATADKIRRDGKRLVLEALTLAEKALKAAPTDADANLAMADVLRLQGKPAVEVRRYLTSVKGDAAAAREVALISALVDLRDKQAAKAKDALTKLDSGDGALEKTGDVRVRWRLATIAAAGKQVDVAKAAAEAVLAAQPDHAGARALLAKVSTVATDDAMPPEEGPGSGSGSGSSPGSGSGSGSGSSSPTPHVGTGEPSAAEGYDRLLAKANKLAEVSCGQAMPYYQKALEEKPNSVEALTGMGYCHLDAQQFSSALSKFRAALGISPRYERALWGMGELYQQQGRAEQAIEAFKTYLEVYPGSVAAQRQLDRLQSKSTTTPTPPENGGGSGSAGGSGPVTSPTTPEPKPELTPPPPPKPAPPPEATPAPEPPKPAPPKAEPPAGDPTTTP